MKNFKEYLNIRSTIYKILSYGFYMEPDAVYFQELKMYIPLFSIYQEHFRGSSIKDGINLLEKFLEYAEKAMDEVVLEHERTFASIFLSPGFPQGIKSVVPHESIYLSDKGWSMQNQRDEVLAFYYAEGVGKTDKFKEPEDHVSAEMNFISLLSQQTIEALSSNDEQLMRYKLKIQFSFLETHLMKWVHRMCEDLYLISNSDFYKALARLTSGFVSADFIFLEAILNEKRQ